MRKLPLPALAIVSVALLTSCGANEPDDDQEKADSGSSPTASETLSESDAASEAPAIDAGAVELKLDGKDVAIESADCVSTNGGVYFNNASGTDLSTLDVTFDSEDKLAGLVIYLGTDYALTYEADGPNASESKLTASVSGDTYTVSGTTPNIADPGADATVEIKATCG